MDYEVNDDFMKASCAQKFLYDDLVSATHNFSEKELLGKGGFGSVYKGFLKELNCHVAVKRVSRDSKQGIKEYASEVKIISQLRHQNIVKLIGWCHERKELLLVYEFMANGSLDSHLFKENRLLTWEVRYKIVQGLAWGLLYLHEQWEQYVVHRDIKPSNIMLDSNFNAKIGDFGLARVGDHGKDIEFTPLAGTIGYVAPEYAATGKASKESDVYSFGVVLLEIACGRKVTDRKGTGEDQLSLREWVWDLYGAGKLLEAADPRLNGEFEKRQMECLIVVGLWCVHPDVKLRPKIEEAIHVLNFVAPLPDLPSTMPMGTYFAVLSSSSSSGSNSLRSKKQFPCVSYNDLICTTQEKIAKGRSGARFKGLNFGFWKRRTEKKELNDSEIDSSLRVFSYEDLVVATNDFSKKVGDAAFDGLYRGFMKELNSYVAVKKVSKDFNLEMKKYSTEVSIAGRLCHRGIVQLIGLCHSERYNFLVYEFMPNGSLDSHLFQKDGFLTWEVRYKIAQRLALTLLYLHEGWKQCVVHRDVKSSNVMLDSNFNPKLWDFGLARLMDNGKSSEKTSVFGKMGYIDPEYFMTGKIGKESDVYSFGIVALEIACGIKPINGEAIEDQLFMVQRVWDLYGKGKLLEATDPKLNGEFNKQQLKSLMIIGLWCANPEARFRPSIRQAVQLLNLEAPLPLLLPKMPHFASSSSRSMRNNDLGESQIQFSGDISETTLLTGR